MEDTTDSGATDEAFISMKGPLRRRLLQLDIDITFIEWHLTYVSVNEVKTDDPVLHHHPMSVTLATKLALDGLMCSLSVQPDTSFIADCWLMDTSLKEVVYTANRRRSSSYDSHRASMTTESYILHQNLHYRKTKPPKIGGGTMDTRRASSKDVVLQVTMEYEYSQNSMNGKGCCISSRKLLYLVT